MHCYTDVLVFYRLYMIFVIV